MKIQKDLNKSRKRGVTYLDRVGVTGSNPVSPTMIKKTK